jgi:hypothetical protein
VLCFWNWSSVLFLSFTLLNVVSLLLSRLFSFMASNGGSDSCHLAFLWYDHPGFTGINIFPPEWKFYFYLVLFTIPTFRYYCFKYPIRLQFQFQLSNIIDNTHKGKESIWKLTSIFIVFSHFYILKEYFCYYFLSA